MEAALIAAIAAAPESVEPWIAYRDWLRERNDRREEWIRLALEGGDAVSRRPISSEQSLLTARLNEQPGEPSTSPASRIEHHRLRELATGSRSCPAVVTGDFDLPNLESLNWDLVEGYERGEVLPGYELFTSSSSILHHAPASLVELRVTAMVGDGGEVKLLDACPVLGQLRRIQLRAVHAVQAFSDLVARAASFRHLESIEVESYESFPRERVVELRAALERALPDTRLDVRWDSLVASDAPSSPSAPVDAASRNSEGRIDAIARWISSAKK